MNEIYNKLRQPPKWALREIRDGDLKGKTDINPQWRYEAMTEVFGLVGIGWKYEIQKLWTEPGGKDEVLAFAQVAVYVRDPETKGWSDAIVGIGGSKLVNNFNKAGIKNNDEGYKMAVTDAFSTALKMLGVAADIYAGKWDGSKYREAFNKAMETLGSTERIPEPAAKPAAAPAPARRAVDIADYLLQKGFSADLARNCGVIWDEAKGVLDPDTIEQFKADFKKASTPEEFDDWYRAVYWRVDAANKAQDALVNGTKSEPEPPAAVRNLF